MARRIRSTSRPSAPTIQPLTILHTDNHLLVVAKPAGVPVVPDASGDPSLLDAAREWVRQRYGKPGKVYLGVVHRLDRPVSGVVVFARTSKGASRLAAQFREHRPRKRYLAVASTPPQPEAGPVAEAGRVEQWLRKDRRRNSVAVVPPETRGAQHAVTEWRLLERAGDGRVLLEFEPAGGRPHQLRVAAASLGAPLLGDLRYGAQAPLPDRSIALHALSLTIEHPTTREALTFSVPPPERPWWRFAMVDAARTNAANKAPSEE